MRILIDADGCPVTQLTVKIAKEYSIEVIIFCDTSHEFNIENVETVTVGKGADSADFALVNRISKGDIVVSQDYGLSAMALSKGAKPVTQNGLVITDFNIDTLLATRHISKKERMKHKHLKGPSKRTDEQDKKFEKSLRRLINESINCT